MGFRDSDILLAEVGYGKISTALIIEKLFPESESEERIETDEEVLERLQKHTQQEVSGGVHVNGMDGLVFRFAKCCEPLPGDELLGFVTRGRGVAIHKRDCTQAMSFDPRRLIDVKWDPNVKTLRNISVNVTCVDRVGILAALTQCISSHGVSIVSAKAVPIQNGKALNTFEIAIESKLQANIIIRALEQIEGVIRVERQKFTGQGAFE